LGVRVDAEIDRLLNLYEQRTISRRGLIEAVAALSVAAGAAQAQNADQAASVVRAKTLNHVTITTSNVSQSTAFYQRLTGLKVRDRAANFCELELENGFLGLYAPWEAKQRLGLDHVCLGIEGYEPKALLSELKTRMPEARPTLEFGDQIYVRDPDGAKVQLAGVKYKRP